MMMRGRRIQVLLLAAGLVAACTGYEEPQPDGDHVWKAQTDSLDRARQVEGVLNSAAEGRRKRIDAQSR